MVTRLRRVMLHVGIGTHVFDTVTDVIFSVKELEKGNVGLAVVMGIFIIGPNIWGNYMSMEMYEYDLANRTPKTNSNVEQEDKNGIKDDPDQTQDRSYILKACFRRVQTAIKRWMFPYPLTSAKHVLYNILCVLQVRPLIMVLDLLYHNRKSVARLGNN